MDIPSDKKNKPKENAIEIAPASEIELVDLEPTEEAKVDDSDSPYDYAKDEQFPQSNASEDSAPAGTGHSLSRLELESLIQKYLDDSEKLKNQLKSQKEMYNSSFENDAEYSQETANANEIKKKVAAIKQRITQQPAVQAVNEKMEEIKNEIKDLQDAISGLAEQYQNVTHTNQIVQDDGYVLEIIRNYKVIRKKA